MADVVWNGSAADGNWNTGANWVGGSRPGNSDTAIIGTTNQAIIGATVAETGLTVRITAGFGGTIGFDAPLIFTNGPALIHYAGTGNYANFGCSGTVTAAKFDHSGSQVVNLSSGTWTLITNSAGNLDIAAATVVTTLNNVSGNVTALYNATAFTTCTTSGRMTCYRNVTTLNCKRGSFTHLNNGITTYTAVTTANVENLATYNKRSGGTDTTLNLFSGGTFTVAGNTGGSAGTVTITTANVWAGSNLYKTVPGLTVTIGTQNDIGAATDSA